MKIEDIPEAKGVSENVPLAAFSEQAIKAFVVALLNAPAGLETEIGIGPMDSTGEMAILVEIKEDKIKAAMLVATAMRLATFLEEVPNRRANEFAEALRHVLRHGAS